MTRKASKTPVEIKMSTLMAVSAILHSAETSVIEASLKTTTGGSTDFFDGEFVIIDVGLLKEKADNIDWLKLIPVFRTYNLNPVAVRNAPAHLAKIIDSHGLSIDQMTTAPRTKNAKVVEEAVHTEVESQVEVVTVYVPGPKTMLVDTPVRGGQRIYAKDCDMIVTAVVNSGAEIIADGSIFMYAPLRGRALAGAKGDTNAKILTTCMEAELVSIAGLYQTFESGVPKEIKGKAISISYKNENLDIVQIETTSKLQV